VINWYVLFFVPIVVSMCLAAAPNPDSPDVNLWVKRVENAFRAASLPPPKRSRQLDRAAAIASRATVGGDVRGLLRQAQVYDGMLLPVVIDQHRNLTVARSGSEYIANHVIPLGVTHYGLAARGERLVVVFTRRMLTIAHFPRPKGIGLVPIEGLIARPYRNARVLIGRPSGQIESYLADVSGGTFRSFVHFRESGEYNIEILARGPRGQEVIALIQIGFGEDTSNAKATNTHRAAGTKVPKAARRALIRWVNRERSKLGLRDLRVDPRDGRGPASIPRPARRPRRSSSALRGRDRHPTLLRERGDGQDG